MDTYAYNCLYIKETDSILFSDETKTIKTYVLKTDKKNIFFYDLDIRFISSLKRYGDKIIFCDMFSHFVKILNVAGEEQYHLPLRTKFEFPSDSVFMPESNHLVITGLNVFKKNSKYWTYKSPEYKVGKNIIMYNIITKIFEKEMTIEPDKIKQVITSIEIDKNNNLFILMTNKLIKLDNKLNIIFIADLLKFTNNKDPNKVFSDSAIKDEVIYILARYWGKKIFSLEISP